MPTISQSFTELKKMNIINDDSKSRLLDEVNVAMDFLLNARNQFQTCPTQRIPFLDYYNAVFLEINGIIEALEEYRKFLYGTP